MHHSAHRAGSFLARTKTAVTIRTLRESQAVRVRVFYGWWVVVACLVVALVGNALGLFGVGVYVHAIIAAKGWSTSSVSGAATLFYMISALLLIPVGSMIGRFGPRSVIALGAIAISGGVAIVGRVSELWQVYVGFLVMGLGWACLSTTSIATTLAPWFEKHQGRAVSIASLGASVGGMIGAPALLLGIDRIGIQATTTVAGLAALAILLPLAQFVLRRRPQDMGLFPDGDPPHDIASTNDTPRWSRVEALRTAALGSVVVTFGIGMMVQIGFLTHQVALTAPSLGASGASATVSATAITALLGRLLLARFADQINERITAAVVLLLAAIALSTLALFPEPAVMVGASAVFGLTVGNVTTISPIIVRREFGAASFGAVFAAASCAIQLATALGPSFYGVLHDAFDSYRPPLLIAGALDVLAAVIIVFGRPKSPHQRP
jgi:MFS family permease